MSFNIFIKFLLKKTLGLVHHGFEHFIKKVSIYHIKVKKWIKVGKLFKFSDVYDDIYFSYHS